MEISSNSGFLITAAKAESSRNILKTTSESPSELEKATKNFEAVLLNMVLQAMWKTIPQSGLFEKENSTQLYEGLMLSSLAEEMAGKGGVGIAKMLYQQLVRDKKQP
ncbi:MAG: rod-binding protein [Candidatus Loosdrechtia sp.]|uniref:rod-binding protein n=1 Tax=Candidatus Loosdrechtia sp. TaxID=3101272 RepID=UPI003A6A6C95|nr:MAG: rod-binding protein [Candidatus Jettenia sp. AMX2]